MLLSVVTSSVVGGVAFGAAPGGSPPPDLSVFARRVGER